MADNPMKARGSGDEREEMGDSASSRAQPPHYTENGHAAKVSEHQDAAPVSPANASGTDKVPTSEQDQGVDDTSMYDRRPEESSHNHPPGS